MKITAASGLTREDVREAVALARSRGQDIHIAELDVGPRGAITLYCESFSGTYAVNRPQEGYFARDRPRAASWAAYGWVIAELFRRSPGAHIGQYKSVEDFRKWCRELHEYWERSARKRPNDPGADISFLELVEEVTA